MKKLLLIFALVFVSRAITPPTFDTNDFSMVILPDAQVYSSTYPAIFDAQCQWIVDNEAIWKIKAVLHVGDVVQLAADSVQWVNAKHSLDILDTTEIPYLVTTGNHDYHIDGGDSTRNLDEFNTNLPQSRYTAHSWFNGSFYQTDRTENAYIKIDVGSYKYGLMVLEFGPRKGALDWANSILSANMDREFIIVTHSFLDTDGKRVTTGDDYNPHSYGFGSDVNDGQEMWDYLIKNHSNIRIIQNGHEIENPTSARRYDLINNEFCYQILANYQTLTNGGNGYLRILHFERSTGKINVYTYSPTLDGELTDATNKFSLTLNAWDTTGLEYACLPASLNEGTAPADYPNGVFPIYSPSASYTGLLENNTAGNGYVSGSVIINQATGSLTLNTVTPDIVTNTDSLTIAIWIKYIGGSGVNKQYYLQYKVVGSDYYFIGVRVDVSNRIVFTIRNGGVGTIGQVVSNTLSWTVGQSYFVEALKAGANLSIRRNGQEVTYFQDTDYSYGTIDWASASQKIGNWPEFNYIAKDAIQALCFYKTERTSTQGGNDYLLGPTMGVYGYDLGNGVMSLTAPNSSTTGYKGANYRTGPSLKLW